jgi:alpha-mannosidase
MRSGRETRWIAVLFALTATPLSALPKDRSADQARILHIEPLPIVLQNEKSSRQQVIVVETIGSTPDVPQRLLVRLGAAKTEVVLDRSKAGSTTQTLIRVPYGSEQRNAEFVLLSGGRVADRKELLLRAVPDFTFALFPSSHMCVAYENTMALTHHDAAFAIGEAVRLLQKYPEAVWSVEFTWALKLYWDKHPEQHDLIRHLVREGRLEVGGRLTPNHQDGLDGESLARQIAVAQWWLEDTFNIRTRVTFDWDNPIYYAQEPQLYKQGGFIGWVAGCYYDCDEDKTRPQTAFREGSPFFNHLGADASAVTMLAPARGLQDVYTVSQVVGLTTFQNGGGLLRTLDPQNMSVAYARTLADLITRTQAVSGLNFLAGSADMGDQTYLHEDLLQKARLWNQTFATPRIEFSSAAALLKKAQASGRVTDQVAEDIPWWIRQAGNMLVLRYRANEISTDLRFAETVAALDSLTLGSLYPAEALDLSWNELLHVEQHEQYFSEWGNGDDILDWSNSKLERAQAIARSVADAAMGDLASRIQDDGAGGRVVAFNRLNWESRDLVDITVPGSKQDFNVFDGSRNAIAATTRPAPGGRQVSFVASVPALGYASYYLVPEKGGNTHQAQAVSKPVIENEFYRLTLDPKTGLMTSLYDKSLQHELVDAVRPSGGFRLVEDDGGPRRATWSISHPSGRSWWQGDFANSTVTTQVTEAGQTLMIRGPLLDDGVARFGDWREVRYRLTPGIARLDISIRYHWSSDKSRRAWLMFDLPLSVRQATVTYGSPYAALDYREFVGDQPALRRIRTMHNWADVYNSSEGFGVTVAGPSTQVEIRPDGIGIALISRHGGTTANDCVGLDGEHQFQYSLRAHRGDWRAGEAIRFGYEHEAGRSPIQVVLAVPRGGNLPARQTLLALNGDRVAVTALKQIHHGQDLVLRLHPTTDQPTFAGLPEATQRGILQAWKSNILEDALESTDASRLGRVEIGRWEIVSLRLRLAERGKPSPTWRPAATLGEMNSPMDADAADGTGTIGGRFPIANEKEPKENHRGTGID